MRVICVYSIVSFSLAYTDDSPIVVTCYSDPRQDFGLEIRFTDHFNTRLVTTLNYSAIADLHTLQITRPHTLSLSSLCSLFTSLHSTLRLLP
jgi:hypothetical protein